MKHIRKGFDCDVLLTPCVFQNWMYEVRNSRSIDEDGVSTNIYSSRRDGNSFHMSCAVFPSTPYAWSPGVHV